MAFDFKKEYKELYMPAQKPIIIEVPRMNYLAVRGEGNPNVVGGAYQKAVELLYGIAYTIKMSKKSDYRIEGYFDFVVPPLEGYWSFKDALRGDAFNKDDFKWVSVIRLPDFVSEADFDWAVQEATRKKKLDFSKVEFMPFEEGLCVQAMHIGSYDEEIITTRLMHEYVESQGYLLDFSEQRWHHEIYLSDPRKVAPEKMKTVIRHPIRKK